MSRMSTVSQQSIERKGGGRWAGEKSYEGVSDESRGTEKGQEKERHGVVCVVCRREVGRRRLLSCGCDCAGKGMH